MYKRPLQARRGHASNQGTGKEEPDSNATNTIQKLVKFQFYSISVSNLKREFSEQAIRHNNTEFCELSGKYAVFCEFAVEGKHVVRGADAEQGDDKEDFDIEDKELVDLLQLPNGSVCV
jgi:hypothetical protein